MSGHSQYFPMGDNLQGAEDASMPNNGFDGLNPFDHMTGLEQPTFVPFPPGFDNFNYTALPNPSAGDAATMTWTPLPAPNTMLADLLVEYIPMLSADNKLRASDQGDELGLMSKRYRLLTSKDQASNLRTLECLKALFTGYKPNSLEDTELSKSLYCMLASFQDLKVRGQSEKHENLSHIRSCAFPLWEGLVSYAGVVSRLTPDVDIRQMLMQDLATLRTDFYSHRVCGRATLERCKRKLSKVDVEDILSEWNMRKTALNQLASLEGLRTHMGTLMLPSQFVEESKQSQAKKNWETMMSSKYMRMLNHNILCDPNLSSFNLIQSHQGSTARFITQRHLLLSNKNDSPLEPNDLHRGLSPILTILRSLGVDLATEALLEKPHSRNRVPPLSPITFPYLTASLRANDPVVSTLVRVFTHSYQPEGIINKKGHERGLDKDLESLVHILSDLKFTEAPELDNGLKIVEAMSAYLHAVSTYASHPLWTKEKTSSLILAMGPLIRTTCEPNSPAIDDLPDLSAEILKQFEEVSRIEERLYVGASLIVERPDLVVGSKHLGEWYRELTDRVKVYSQGTVRRSQSSAGNPVVIDSD